MICCIFNLLHTKVQNILQCEDIAKTHDIKGKFKKIWFGSDHLETHLNILGFNKIRVKFSWCKKAGFSFHDLIAMLLILPLMDIHSIYGLINNK